ncbi:MAG: YdjY domain-containing protein [Planctomycetia bacterium]|nr:YdjY domain-containing protein [Planctomycetia bacterium]
MPHPSAARTTPRFRALTTAARLVVLLAVAETLPCDRGAARPAQADEAAVAERAPEPATPEPLRPDRHPELKRLSTTEDVWIDAAKKHVVVGARVVLDKGPIEVFACPERSKEHEAVVATHSTARLVHAALLAIGLEPGKPVSFDPVYAAAEGPVVKITMRWKDDTGKVRESPAQDWIRDTTTKKPLEADWVFAGSSFWRDPSDGTDYYQADGGDLICVSNFPTATLDLPIESSQSNDALMFEAFPGHVPPNGTEVEMILSAAPQADAPADSRRN